MEVVSGHAKGDVDSNADTQIGDTAVVRITPDKTCSDRVVVRFFFQILEPKNMMVF